MNQYVTGAIIRELREKHRLTQAELAEKLFISDKTISKWENGKGYPDISLLEPLAGAFGISVAELLAGRAISNVNGSANMLRSKFYVCPVCGNVLHAMGEAAIHCHGVLLTPEQSEPEDDAHRLEIETVEDEYYVHIDHEMTKQHYISFVAAVSPDRIQMVKLYPEGNAEARFQLRGVMQILYCCNRDGLFAVRVRKGTKVHKTPAVPEREGGPRERWKGFHPADS